MKSLLILFVLIFTHTAYAENQNDSIKNALWHQINQDSFPALLAERASASLAEASINDLILYKADTSKFDLALNRAYFYNMLAGNEEISDSIYNIAVKKSSKALNEITGYKAVYDYLNCKSKPDCILDSNKVDKLLQVAYDKSLLTPSAQWDWIKSWISNRNIKIDYSENEWMLSDSLKLNEKLWLGGILPVSRFANNYRESLLISGGTRVPLIMMEKDSSGNWTDVTAAAGIDNFPGGEVLYTVDYNNDGLQDVFVIRKSANIKSEKFIPYSLLRNNGDGSFVEVTGEVGLNSLVRSSCACWLDVNNDGLIDLFVGGEGTPSRFFIQNGKGQFDELGRSLGVNTVREKIVDCTVLDINEDGFDDLYLSVLGGNNKMYLKQKLNEKFWFFVDKADSLKMTSPFLGGILKTADFDGDGKLELLAGTDGSYDGEMMMHALNGYSRGLELPLMYKIVSKDSLSINEFPVELSTMRTGLLVDGGADSRPVILSGGGVAILDMFPLVQYKYFFVPVPDSRPKLYKPHNWPLYVHSMITADFNGNLEPEIWVKGGERYPVMAQSILSYKRNYQEGSFVYIKPEGRINKDGIGAVVKVLFRDASGKVFIKTRKITAMDTKGNGTGQFYWFLPKGYYLINANVLWSNQKNDVYYFTDQTKRYLLKEGNKYPVAIN